MAATPDEIKYQSNLFAGMMTELKIRLFSMRQLVKDNQLHHPQIIHEICDLQIRMCCEVVALACLMAHEDIASARAQKAYEPSVMMKGLELLHPDFFPKPAKVEWADSVGRGQFHIAPGNPSAITQKEVVKLWSSLGGRLHRGTLKALRSGERPVQSEYPEVDQQIAKFEALLEHHYVISRDRSWVFLCNGRLDEPTEHVECWLASAVAVE